ncbi:MAG: hypothetical protein IPJ22_11200 [Bacteroidetes bacterium]|nr:hypothetical protein [Bacteroidota bacterium]
MLSVLTVGTTTTASPNICQIQIPVCFFGKRYKTCGGVVSSISRTQQTILRKTAFCPLRVVTSVNIGNFLEWTPSTFPGVTGYLIF